MPAQMVRNYGPNGEDRGWRELRPGETLEDTSMNAAQARAAQRAMLDRSKKRWGIADKVAYGVATIPFGAAGASALGWGGATTTPMSNLVAQGVPAAAQVPAGTFAAGAPLTGAVGTVAPTAGITLGTGGATLPTFGAGSALPTVAGGAGGGGGAGGILGTIGSWAGRGNNAIELGKMGVGGLTSWLQNRSTQNALKDSNALTLADNAAQRDFLREQYDREHQDYLDAIAEQKRQWDEEQKEKARVWEAMEPWREAGRGNLTRMNSLLDEPRPGRVAYQPTFQYRP
jgi:hypothetical protein